MHYFGTLVPKGDYMAWQTTQENINVTYKNDFDLTVKFRKLFPEAVTPQYAQDGDAGMDLTATSVRVTDTFIEYGTGIAVEIPHGHVGLLFPRSSITKLPAGVSLKNSVGVIDSNYRGEILARFELPYTWNKILDDVIREMPLKGDKVAQLLIIPYPKVHLEEVQELSNSNRGDGGFGSTDKK
jgi:dUTP pyrophosphatase